jgi:hypothetical protein
VAKIELSVMQHQGLDRRSPDESTTSVDPHATHGTRSLVAPHDSSPAADARVRQRCGAGSNAPWPKASQAVRRLRGYVILAVPQTTPQRLAWSL